MAYEITATRKRPQTFEELAGQDFVSTTLRASIASGRIAHAYLFSGPRGCGKTSTARILAKALNCENGPTAEPCGVCDSCKAIARGAALDVIEIDGASNTSVDNVRQIKDEVLFPPNSSKYKIYIIDEVHMLSNSAFNALLKTIEEPPPYIVFIFATTELHKVPATIKSRCQQFNFRLIGLDAIKERLSQAAGDLGVKADDDALLWIAREATGSLRDAYTLFDQVASFSDGHITAEKIRDKLGLVGGERMGAIFELCVKGQRGPALELMDSILASGVSVEQFTQDAVSYARSLLLIASGVDREALLGAPRASFPHSILDGLDAPRLERVLANLFDLHRNMRYSVNPRWELELAVSRLSTIKDYIPPADLSKAVANLKAAVSGGLRVHNDTPDSAPETRQSPPPQRPGHPKASVQADEDLLSDAPAQADMLTDPAAFRAALIASLGKNRVLLSLCLERSGPWSMDGDTLVVPCGNGYDANTVMSDAALVAKKAAELAGRAIKVEARASVRSQTESRETTTPSGNHDDEGSSDGDDGPGNPVEIVERVFRGRRVQQDSNGPQ
ncbi:MAG: DNA polymerase III subunit gamma/tau [Spirochaetales bacterium]|nr:DNA polymerase III subunit gamma/tau [Spirochaetales bacterium]